MRLLLLLAEVGETNMPLTLGTCAQWMLTHGPYFIALGLGATLNSLQVGCPKASGSCRRRNVSRASECIRERRDQRWRPQELRVSLRLDVFLRPEDKWISVDHCFFSAGELERKAIQVAGRTWAQTRMRFILGAKFTWGISLCRSRGGRLRGAKVSV